MNRLFFACLLTLALTGCEAQESTQQEVPESTDPHVKYRKSYNGELPVVGRGGGVIEEYEGPVSQAPWNRPKED